MKMIQLENVNRFFQFAGGQLHALKNINLSIDKGEFIAIVGASGSGKSTLMNILGCLDRPSSGVYSIEGRNSTLLNDDEVSQLRREKFGFIFQSYHLLTELSATENVELPAVYAGVDSEERHARATRLLTRFGLKERLHHRPAQLSGGQQQRISIARALMNGGSIILADEPTGALDSASGQDVLEVLRTLQRSGHTVIIITHDTKVARHADRIVELLDGEIIQDTLQPQQILQDAAPENTPALSDKVSFKTDAGHSLYAQMIESVKLSTKTLISHKLRSALTVLGIIIGISSVVSIIAIGEGMRASVLNSFSEVANTSMMIMPGSDMISGSEPGKNLAGGQNLTAEDVALIASQPYVQRVAPKLETSGRLRHYLYDIEGSIKGASPGRFSSENAYLLYGRDFSNEELKNKAQVVIIDSITWRKLFPDGKNPVGIHILVGALPCKVIGVVKSYQGDAGEFADNQPKSWVPYTTAMFLLLGKNYLDSIAVKLHKNISPEEAEAALTHVLSLRHGSQDFFISNNEKDFAALQKTTLALALGLACVGGISLLVGGVGVMNIMLVSVSERIREIGIRRAVGARKRDIMAQFLIESILLCVSGGLLGIGVGIIVCQVASSFTTTIQIVVSGFSITVAFITSLLIGVGFGVVPAQKAARLDPVAALSQH